MSATSSSFTELDDASLILRIQAGDAAALLELYEAAYPALTRFAYQITRARETAEDAVHTVFLNVWTNRASWRPHTPLRPYLYRAVRNAVLKTMAHGNVIERAELAVDLEEPYGMGHGPDDPAALVETADTVRAVAAAIRGLPERQRTAIILRWYDEMTTAAIAEAMGVSRQAVEKLLRTAEGRLRGSLGDVTSR